MEMASEDKVAAGGEPIPCWMKYRRKTQFQFMDFNCILNCVICIESIKIGWPWPTDSLWIKYEIKLELKFIYLPFHICLWFSEMEWNERPPETGE